MNSLTETSSLAVQSENIAAGGALFISLAALLGFLIFAGCALVSILGSGRYSSLGKLLWILAVFAFPFLGSLAWFTIGRKLVLDRSY
jgi:hypothetical protein